MKFMKKVRASADLNLQWVMWIGIILIIMSSLFVFRTAVFDFLVAAKGNVTNVFGS